LALPNPYDPAARSGVDFPLDFSLYRGRFYLYFGPTPALILAAVKAIRPFQIGDQYVVFAAVYGIFLLESLLLTRIWRRFFAGVRLWAFPVALLAIGLTSPFTWILAVPKIYGAAITTGQFFFLGGLLAAFIALDGALSPNRVLVLAGVCLAAAVSSRITQIVPAGFLATMVLIGIINNYSRSGMRTESMRATLAFALPLALGAAGLGWYNWARFGNVFETGISYQLTGVPLRQIGPGVYSPAFILQNLYIYLFNAPELKFAFPYLRPMHGPLSSILTGFPLPKIYFSQEITGVFYSAPLVVLALTASKGPIRDVGDDYQRSAQWLTAALWGSFFSGFGLCLLFFWSSERYFGDFLPALLLLAAMGFWQLCRPSTRARVPHMLGICLAIGLMVASVCVSSLLALSINSDGFRALNPVLWRTLSNLFRP
jgi:hypothetical protein